MATLRTTLVELETGSNAVPANSLPRLLELLAFPDKKIRRHASGVLQRIASAHEDHVAAGMEAADPLARWGAAFALGRAGLGSRRVAEIALEALGNEDGDVRWAAASLLEELATTWAELPDRLRASATGATTSSPTARKMAIFCLRDLGMITAEVCRAALDAPDPEVRLAALAALTRCGDVREAVLEAVAGLVETDSEVGVRRAAVAILGRLPSTSGGVLAALERAAVDGDVDVARLARAALAVRGK